MEPPSEADDEKSSAENQEETRCITTRVAKIRFTGVIASDDQPCYSSDEEVIEALSLCNNPPDAGTEQFFLLNKLQNSSTCN